VFGPVPSRRLGRSLGVNLVPLKTCDYNCVYCQLGRTTNYTITRREWVPRYEVLNEIINALEGKLELIDYLTFIGDGEPLLNSSIGWLIDRVRELFGSSVRIAVWSNGSLLINDSVRSEVLDADVVKVTLDAGDERTYELINRPYPTLKLHDVVNSFSEFRRVFEGNLWVEVMLVNNLNDSVIQAEYIGKLLKDVRPDKVHITVPTRPPTEEWVRPPPSIKLIRVCRVIRRYVSNVEILPLYEGSDFVISDLSNVVNELLSIIKVHPMRKDQLINILSRFNLSIDDVINELTSRGVVIVEYEGKEFLVFRGNA